MSAIVIFVTLQFQGSLEFIGSDINKLFIFWNMCASFMRVSESFEIFQKYEFSICRYSASSEVSLALYLCFVKFQVNLW